jgi:hypothetical protein
MLDAGIDAIGYAAFVQSEGYEKYPGIHKNLGALHEYLLSTPEPEIINYDLQVFLIVLRAAREVMPALAAATAALESLLTEERIFSIRGRRLPEYDKLPRRIDTKRQQFAEFFGELSDLNEVVARFFPLLLQKPDETVLSYREMKEKILATRRNSLHVQLEVASTNKTRIKTKGSAVAAKSMRLPRNVGQGMEHRPSSIIIVLLRQPLQIALQEARTFLCGPYLPQSRNCMRNMGEDLRRRKENGFAMPEKRGQRNLPCVGSYRTTELGPFI